MATSDGFISRTLARIRTFTDEPATSAKYTDAKLLDLIENQWAAILGEFNRVSQHPTVIRHNVTFGETSRTYVLPPTVGSVLRLAKISTTTNSMEWEVIPLSRNSPTGPGVTMEGNILRLEPDWEGDDVTFQVDYIPTGDVRLHDGTAGTITNDTTAGTCTLVLAASPTTGVLDNRPNAYAGSVLRILSASTNNYVQERIISAYDVTTRTATLRPHFDATLLPGGATVTYEIAPILWQSNDMVVALAVAKLIAGVEGDNKRFAALGHHLAQEMRRLRLDAASFDAIKGVTFEHDTVTNRRYVSWWGGYA